jgi:hypothetical protein
MIEPREVIHMCMAHEYVADAQQYPRREGRDIAEIEQNGTALKFEVDTDTGVTPNAIEELCVKDRLHLCSLPTRWLTTQLPPRAGGFHNTRVLSAMREVPREKFVNAAAFASRACRHALGAEPRARLSKICIGQTPAASSQASLPVIGRKTQLVGARLSTETGERAALSSCATLRWSKTRSGY